MGRNRICDVYLQLQGMLVTSKVTGQYVSIGMRGDQQLGYFTLERRSQ